MKKAWPLLLCLIFAGSLSVVSMHGVYQKHRGGDKAKFSRLIYYPSSFVQAISFEFPGLVADYLLLNAMVFHGQKLVDEVEVKPEEWKLTYQSLKLIIDLDPSFFDPYLMAETSLPWDAGMVEETNQLLLRLAKQRPGDYRPYFFLWFNHYYFLHDPGTAGIYLRKASRLPGSPKYYKTLAARMSLEAGRVITGISFLSEMIHETRDPQTKAFLQKRLDALKIIYFLENKVQEYEQKFNRSPESLADLVKSEIIEKIPEDPYGGNFYLTGNGRVYTTSRLAQIQKKP